MTLPFPAAVQQHWFQSGSWKFKTMLQLRLPGDFENVVGKECLLVEYCACSESSPLCAAKPITSWTSGSLTFNSLMENCCQKTHPSPFKVWSASTSLTKKCTCETWKAPRKGLADHKEMDPRDWWWQSTEIRGAPSSPTAPKKTQLYCRNRKLETAHLTIWGPVLWSNQNKCTKRSGDRRNRNTK